MGRKKTKMRQRFLVPRVVCRCGNDVYALYSNGKWYCNSCGASLDKSTTIHIEPSPIVRQPSLWDQLLNRLGLKRDNFV